MASKLKKHLKKKFSSGKVVIPHELEFLSSVDFFAVEEHRVLQVKRWYVVIKSSLLKNLLSAKKKLKEARSQVRALKAENQSLRNEAELLNEENAQAEANYAKGLKNAEASHAKSLKNAKDELTKVETINATILKNAMEDQSSDKFPRSRKNIFNKADDNTFTPASNKPCQGGSPGLGKKK